ncbi:hypothetical protein GGU11DRAFT_212298 [Lentinula aff. detonsa]|nr:hypothetical protein GGU11DRAFT_212298 [Lentinula aff. detonsa]
MSAQCIKRTDSVVATAFNRPFPATCLQCGYDNSPGMVLSSAEQYLTNFTSACVANGTSVQTETLVANNAGSRAEAEVYIVLWASLVLWIYLGVYLYTECRGRKKGKTMENNKRRCERRAMTSQNESEVIQKRVSRKIIVLLCEKNEDSS